MSGRHQQQLEKEVSSSSRLNHVLANANRILMSTEQNDQNLQNLITEEVMVITQILQKLVGTNFSLSEIKKYVNILKMLFFFVKFHIVFCPDYMKMNHLPIILFVV